MPEGFYKLSPDSQKAWLKGMEDKPFEEAENAKDRREMVRPAPAGFKPENGRKVKLTLIAKSRTIRKGEPFWYSLELQNVSPKPIDYRESRDDCFFKCANDTGKTRIQIARDGDEFRFPLWPMSFACPGGSIVRLRGWERMTDLERAQAINEYSRTLRFSQNLRVTLQPGETLLTRAWQYHKAEPGCAKDDYRVVEPVAPVGWRELGGSNTLDEPGLYRIKATFADSPKPHDEQTTQLFIKRGFSRKEQLEDYRKAVERSLGTAESNVIEIAVHP
jgi:hypothetical protein